MTVSYRQEASDNIRDERYLFVVVIIVVTGIEQNDSL